MCVKDFLNEHGLQLNTRYTISAGEIDTLSGSVVREIDATIDSYNKEHSGVGYEIRIPRLSTLISYPEKFGLGWELYKYEEKSFATRYARLVKQKTSVNLEDGFVGKVGEICKRLSRGEVYSIDLVDRCEWEPGDFGESRGSCWWDEDQFEHARIGLFENGGGAIRVFENEKSDRGIGRAWLYSAYDRLFLFNSYLRDDGLNNMIYGGMLANLLKLNAYSEYIEVEGAYINGDCSCIIQTEEQSNQSHTDYELDFAEGWTQCSNCGRSVRDGDISYVNDSPYCDRCADNMWTCDHCGDTYNSDEDSYIIGGETWCDYCFSNHAFVCEHCGNDFPDNQSNDFEGDTVCLDCYDELIEEAKQMEEKTSV